MDVTQIRSCLSHAECCPYIHISLGYKCLGMTISARERDSTPEILRRAMNHLTVAPLKPQQRVFFLRVNLLSKLHHRLVLARSRGGVLRQLDKLVRNHQAGG